MSVKVEVGQWYRTLANQIVKCIHVHPNRGYLLVFKDGSCGYYPPDQAKEHLPGCIGFDWEPPKPIEPPEGWRLLTEGEVIIAGDICADELGRWVDEPVITKDEIFGEKWDNSVHYAVARKIEPKYRPFKNAEEFKINLDDNHYLILNVMVKCKNPS